jgi:hypothetical protein
LPNALGQKSRPSKTSALDFKEKPARFDFNAGFEHYRQRSAAAPQDRRFAGPTIARVGLKAEPRHWGKF